MTFLFYFVVTLLCLQDEAYGGSAASEDEEVRQITGDSEDNRADDSEDQDVSKLVKNSVNRKVMLLFLFTLFQNALLVACFSYIHND